MMHFELKKKKFSDILSLSFFPETVFLFFLRFPQRSHISVDKNHAAPVFSGKLCLQLARALAQGSSPRDQGGQ